MDKGLTFYSPYANYQRICKHEVPDRFDTSGTKLVEKGKAALIARFGVLGEEFTFTNPMTGEQDTGARITGHFFNSVAAQGENGWSDEEREYVERDLLEQCERQPEFIQLYAEVAPTAPWPTYDETPAKGIVDIAVATGMVDSALAYERQNKARKSVVSELEEAKKTAEQAAQLEAPEELAVVD